MAKPSFDKLLLEAVEEGLGALGESPKQAIYFHLEKSFNIRKEEIPHRIEAALVAIEKIFGVGAKFIETEILNNLCEKALLKGKEDSFQNLTLPQSLTAVKKMMEP